MSDVADHGMTTLERLVYMANQIARNFEAIGHDAAAAATADHIASIRDPRMKQRIFAFRAGGAAGLSACAHLHAGSHGDMPSHHRRLRSGDELTCSAQARSRNPGEIPIQPHLS